jgi:hypothetical protein
LENNDDSFGEAKPDFKEERCGYCPHFWPSFMIRIHTYIISRIALENKVAAEEPLSDVNDDSSVHSESVASDIDVDEVMEEENEQETGNPLAQVTSTKSTELKDLFAPREEEEGKYFPSLM